MELAVGAHDQNVSPASGCGDYRENEHAICYLEAPVLDGAPAKKIRWSQRDPDRIAS